MPTSSPQNSPEESFRKWLDIHHPTSRRLILSIARKLKLWDISASQETTQGEILRYSENLASRRRARSVVVAWAKWQKEALGLDHWILKNPLKEKSAWVQKNISAWDELSLRVQQRTAMALALESFSLKEAAHLKVEDQLPAELGRWKKRREFFRGMKEAEFTSMTVKRRAKNGGNWWQVRNVVKRFISVKKEWATSDLMFPSFQTGNKISRASWMRVKLKTKK